MDIMRGVQKNFNRAKIISGAVQDEVTSAVIRSIDDVENESGPAEALKVANLFNKAISLYSEGVPLAAALLAVSELSKEKKSPAKLLGFTAIGVASILPYLLINQDKFEDCLEDLRNATKKEDSRKGLKSSKVTKLSSRRKKS